MSRSPVYLTPEELEKECRFERLRRSGPGGQNRNKVETAVRFYHLPSGLVGEASERRYQGENRKIALERLRIELALSIRDVPDLEIDEHGAAKLPQDFVQRARWFARLQGDKIRVATSNFDYAILVAEFFDVYAATKENLALTAELLQTTPSQIVKFLAETPKTLEKLNSMRVKQGLGRLKL